MTGPTVSGSRMRSSSRSGTVAASSWIENSTPSS
jgi:hypothetical protein